MFMNNIGKINKNSGFIIIIKGCVISLILSIVFMFLYAIILTNTDIQENTIKPVIITITGISLLIGTSICCLKTNKKGILNGVLVGGIYFIMLYILSSIILCGFSLNLESIIMILVGMFLGGIGGIIGVNIGTNRHK